MFLQNCTIHADEEWVGKSEKVQKCADVIQGQSLSMQKKGRRTMDEVCQIFSDQELILRSEKQTQFLDFGFRMFHNGAKFRNNVQVNLMVKPFYNSGSRSVDFKRVFCFFQFSRKTIEKFLPQQARARINIFKFVFGEN